MGELPPKDMWSITFAQGRICIHNVSADPRIEVRFPEEDHWTYTGRFLTEEDGDRRYQYFKGAKI